MVSDSLAGDRSPPPNPDFVGIRKRWSADWVQYAVNASSPISTWDLAQIALADVAALLGEIDRLRAARGGSPPNTDSPEISTPLVVGGSPAHIGRIAEYLCENFADTNDPSEAHDWRFMLPEQRQKWLDHATAICGGSPAGELPKEIEHAASELRQRLKAADDTQGFDQLDGYAAVSVQAWAVAAILGHLWAAASGSARPPEPTGFIPSRPSPDAIRAALGHLPGRAIATDHEWWQCANALKAAYAVDFAGSARPGAADPEDVEYLAASIRGAQMAGSDRVSVPIALAKRLRAALSGGAADPTE